MKENQSNLSAKQEKAIMALLTEPTIRQAAEVSGVGETSIYRWLQEKEFSQAFRDARKKAFSQTVSRLQQATTDAVQTLQDIMTSADAPASSRVTAAKTVIEMAYKAYEMEDLASELEEIKNYIEETKAVLG
jgi:transposase